MKNKIKEMKEQQKEALTLQKQVREAEEELLKLKTRMCTAGMGALRLNRELLENYLDKVSRHPFSVFGLKLTVKIQPEFAAGCLYICIGWHSMPKIHVRKVSPLLYGRRLVDMRLCEMKQLVRREVVATCREMPGLVESLALAANTSPDIMAERLFRRQRRGRRK